MAIAEFSKFVGILSAALSQHHLLGLGHLMKRADSLAKTLMLGKIEGGRRKGATEDERVRWHHRLNGHDLEQTPGDSGGQGSLARCGPWGRKESDTTERLNSSICQLSCAQRHSSHGHQQNSSAASPHASHARHLESQNKYHHNRDTTTTTRVHTLSSAPPEQTAGHLK